MVLVSLLVVDWVSGFAFKTGRAASLVLTRGEPHAEAMVVFPGYAGGCESVSRAFLDQRSHGEALAVVCYPERGVDDGQLYGLLSSALKELAPSSIKIVGGSLGGMVAAKFLHRWAQDPANVSMAPVDLVLDTAPSGPTTVMAPNWALALGHWYRGGVLSSLGWAAISGLSTRPVAEPEASRETIRAGDEFNRWIGFPALASQAAYMDDFDLREVEGLSSLVSCSVYLHSDGSGTDPLVATEASIEEWHEVLPGLRTVAVQGRDPAWHLPWTFRPHESMAAIETACH